MAKLSSAKYIYEVHDLWPLSPMELGGMSKFHPFIVAMQHAENFAYRKADAVVSMLPKTQEHMRKHGLDLKKWHYIPNGVILDEWENRVELNSKIKSEIQKIKSRFNKIVAYTGTLGLANALDSFVLSAKKIIDIAFVIVGKGPEWENLENLIKKENIQNVFIFESVNKQEIPALLDEFDYLYIGLQYQALFRFGISPNKLIDYMMSGKPVIQAVKAGNNVVKEVGCGIDIEPENPKAIAEAIKILSSMPVTELKKMGENGKNFVSKNHDYKVLAQRFIDVFSA
jgi:glycosyltransferase involved in cell wall biosynthesis